MFPFGMLGWIAVIFAIVLLLAWGIGEQPLIALSLIALIAILLLIADAFIRRKDYVFN